MREKSGKSISGWFLEYVVEIVRFFDDVIKYLIVMCSIIIFFIKMKLIDSEIH